MLSPWRFLWVSLARSPSPERQSYLDKNEAGKQNKMSRFNTKIKRVANKQKMSREVNEGVWFWGRDMSREMEENGGKQQKSRKGGWVHKQADGSK